jgi:DNA-directed RNA polymerase specialized sigma24 family protein
MDKNTANRKLREDFWNCARRISHSKARKLVGRFGFTVHDLPDIEQELLLALVKRHCRYDPERARETTFIMRVIESKIADIIAHRQAGCRDWRQCGPSLNAPAAIPDVGNSDLLETISSETGSDFYLKFAVAEIIEKLHPELAELCELLKHYSITEILDNNLISRNQFHQNLRKLQKVFNQSFSNGKFP